MPAKWLLKKNKMTDDEVNQLSWWGFNQKVKDKFMRKLSAKFPNHDRTLAWPMNEVYTVAKEHYNPLNFDRNPPFLELGGSALSKTLDNNKYQVVRVKKKLKPVQENSDSEETVDSPAV